MMGIHDLWEILEAMKQEKTLADFRGKKLAIDLGGWLVECKTKNGDFANRSIFFRVLSLMSNGITPVFVADSLTASHLKKKKRGQPFFNWAEQWREVLTAMGFIFIRSNGEAEKTCAHLTSSKAVDGCVTNDGDAFAYGATSVLRGFKAKSKEIHWYESSTIMEKLHLGQKEMVAVALLTGCDFCSGINGIGIKTSLHLLQELKRNNIDNVLDWMRSLRTSNQLGSLKETMKAKQGMKRGPHCLKCSHLGSVNKHNKNGCATCSTCEGCKEQNSENDDSVPCPCQFHTLESEVNPFLTELKVFEAALEQLDFPDEEVITEFLCKDQSVSIDTDLSAKKPDYQKLIQLLTESIGISEKDANHFFPVLVKFSLYGQPSDVKIHPVRIERNSRQDNEQCYLVEFKKFDFDNSSDNYKIHVAQKIFDEKFPEMSPAIGKQKSKKKQEQTAVSNLTNRKRGSSQQKLTDMFKIKKKTTTGGDNQS